MLISLSAHEEGMSIGTPRFCKNDFDSSLESLTVTQVESSHYVKNVSRVTILSQRDSSRVRVTKNRDSSRVIDSSHAVTEYKYNTVQ